MNTWVDEVFKDRADEVYQRLGVRRCRVMKSESSSELTQGAKGKQFCYSYIKDPEGHTQRVFRSRGRSCRDGNARAQAVSA